MALAQLCSPSLAAPPSPIGVSLLNITLSEGTGGSVTAYFPLTLSAPASQDLQIAYQTRDGSALAGVDYVERQGVHTIPAGTTTSAIPVVILSDDLAESVETFDLRLLPSPGVELTGPNALGTIIDDDLPRISLRNVTVPEGSGFETPVRVPVTLSNPSSFPVSVQVTASAGSAEAPADFTPTQRVVTFLPGSLWEYFEFPLNADNVAEFDETIRVELSKPVNASLDVASSEVLVIDDDTIPIISVASASTREGTGVETSLDFRVALSGPALQPVRVSYFTRGDTADPAIDYIQRIGTLVIPPGETEAILEVRVIGDAIAEPDEQLFMILRNPVNATLGTETAPGVIQDDDRQLTISVSDTSSPEGSPGSPRQLTFDVVLSEPPLQPVVVNYATRGLTATPGSDYLTTSGLLTFVTIGPGSTRHQVRVPIVGDTELEPNETVQLVLSDPRNAVLGNSEATGTILNDDGSTLVIDDLSVTEGDDTEVTAPFTVRRLGPTDEAVLATFSTFPLTASDETDFVPSSGVVTIPAGEVRAILPILIRPDRVSETTETFEVRLSDSLGASLLRATAIGTILDNDLPSFTVDPVGVVEGNFGPSYVSFTVRLDFAPAGEVSVQYHVEPVTAVEGEDYLPVSGTLIFPSGILERPVAVPVLGDTLDEDDESFALVLSQPRFARVATPVTHATLIDDDPMPLVSIEDAEARECSSGDPGATVDFRVHLSAPSGRPVEVPFQTRPVTAFSDSDFTPITNTVVFPPGTTLELIRIPITCDDVQEPDEIFEIILGAPKSAILSRARARARLLDDDVPPPPNLPPTVSLSVPAEADLATAGAPITLTALASDPEGALASVSFHADDQLLGQVDVPPFTLVWSNPPPGEHTLIARAVDQAGLAASSAPQKIRILPPAQLLASSVNAIESDRAARVPLTLSRAARETVRATLTTRDLSAVQGLDYSPLTTDVIFLPGLTNLIVAIPLIDDAVHEPVESFLVDLEFPENVDLGSPRLTLTVTIEDDDPPPPPPNLPPTVSLSVPAEADLATAGAPITLTALASDPEGALTSVSFHANDQLLGEGNFPPFTLVWSNPPPGEHTLIARAVDQAGLAASSAPRTVRILPPAQLLASSVNAIESDRAARVPLTLSRAARETVRVTLTTRDLSAVQGLDYSPLTTDVVFPPGLTNLIVTIPLIDDALHEPVESFLVDLEFPENVDLGVPRLTLTVTIEDDDPVPPTNAPPTVVLSSPGNFDILAPDEPLVMEASASDPEGPVARVEFFVDDVRVGVDETPPFRWIFSPIAPGDHLLAARAIDASGAIAESAPVQIAIALPCGNVAVVADESTGEVDRLREFLFELGQPSVVVERASATAGFLATFDLVIWHDTGPRGLRVEDVHLVESLANAGVALYFIGDRLMESAAELDPGARALWIELTRLRPGPSATPVPRVTLTSDELPSSIETIIRRGKAGDVADFDYPFSEPTGTRSELAQEWVLARAGAREILIAVPDDPEEGTGRRLSQSFQVTAGGDTPSRTERKRLFQNAVWWLLDCSLCSNLNLTPVVSVEPAPAPDEGDFAVTIRVHPSGACEALAVRVTCQLSPNLGFVRAESERGSWSVLSDLGIVTFVLGRLPNGIDETIQVVARPLRSGAATVRVAIQSLNETAGALADNEATVSLDVQGPPGLGIRRRLPGILELEVGGNPGVSYRIEAALSPTGPWVEVLPVIPTPEEPVVRIPVETTATPRFFRVRAP